MTGQQGRQHTRSRQLPIGCSCIKPTGRRLDQLPAALVTHHVVATAKQYEVAKNAIIAPTRVGYQSEASFFRAFSKTVGVAPGSLRRSAAT